MPLYDYKCKNCDKTEKDRYVSNRNSVVKCDNCGEKMSRLFPTTVNPLLFPNGGIHLENVSPEGKTFHSYREMRRYAKKHNLELGALL